LASFTAIYLEHLALEENEALPVLWDRCSDDELFGIMTAFKSSLSSVENLTSVIAQLPTLNPAELTHLVSVGIDTSELPSLAQLLATTLNPLQLGALPHDWLEETVGDQS
jgi:type II secretory pathway component PulF